MTIHNPHLLLVVCKDDDNGAELSAELSEKVQWRLSAPGMEDLNAHERLVRMAKAGLPKQALVDTLKIHGVPQVRFFPLPVLYFPSFVL